MKARVLAWVGAILVVGCAYASPGDGMDLRIAPPKIAFGDWRRLSETETTVEYAIEFPSPVATPYPVNNRVPIRALLPQGTEGPMPVVVVLHYWGASDQRVDVALAQELNSRGVAAVLVTLPYHLSRTPPGATSGQYAIEPDPPKMRRTMEQSVLDVRRTVDWIASRPEFDTNKIGLAGTSLGAIVGATAYAVEPRFAAASFVLGGADLAHILWHSSRVVQQREVLRGAGYLEGSLRDELSSIEPLTYLSERRPAPVFLVGARYDSVIPPADTEKLRAALPGSQILWVDTGHYGGVFVQRKILRLVAEFEGAALEGRPFSAPERIYAPTLRIGVEMNSARGLQVAAGIDLWRTSPKAEGFATFLVTPKGAEVFLGHTISNGFAVGFVAKPSGISLGAFWSTIL
ncbi:MAG: prolyl oligopeptidase family serine peptidase [Fimbriimonadaceae bacterium]|nr:prolyl oligopeptidase family serine peptidase [Chthonomonadaceae bacterium]MCO5296379.1 prolyl oligopeptidase family serine peptidase [Fimbriimonadaceae bacterium]